MECPEWGAWSPPEQSRPSWVLQSSTCDVTLLDLAMIELAEICRIGPTYLKTGKRDGRKLVAAVELFRSDSAPSIDDLVLSVRATDGCVEGWLQWSDDKAWTPSWYFSDYGENMFVVGLAAGDDSHEHVFDDGAVACAHFIVKDVEDYGRILDARRSGS